MSGDNIDAFELSRRKVLAGMGSIGVAAAGAGLGTSAFFSDQETFANNQLVAGSLDVKVGYSAHYSDWSADEGDGVQDVQMWDGAPNTVGSASDLPQGYTGLPANDAWLIAVTDPGQFLSNTQYSDADLDGASCEGGNDAQDLEAPVVDLEDVKPGDFGEVTFDFAICDNPGYVWVSGEVESASENGITEPEADDPDEEDGVVELLDVVRVAVWVDDGNNYQNGEEALVGVFTLREVMEGALDGGGGIGVPVPGNVPAAQGGGTGRNCFEGGGAEHSIAFAWWVPVDHGNEIQTDSVRFRLGLYAEQCRHNDGSGLQRDFRVRIENVSTPNTLDIPDDGSVAVPLSPGAYAVHDENGPMFTPGEAASEGLEDVAEDGMPGVLASEIASAPGVSDSGVFALDETATDPNQPPSPAPQPPIFPGGAYEFTVPAGPGDSLSFATMFIQSNDLFYAPGPAGIPLFDAAGTPVSGDVTDQVALWDASTEEDQQPGTGPDQAPRQSGPDTGPADSNSSTVQLVSAVNDEGYSYPDVDEVIEVTVTPL